MDQFVNVGLLAALILTVWVTFFALKEPTADEYINNPLVDGVYVGTWAIAYGCMMMATGPSHLTHDLTLINLCLIFG